MNVRQAAHSRPPRREDRQRRQRQKVYRRVGVQAERQVQENRQVRQAGEPGADLSLLIALEQRPCRTERRTIVGVVTLSLNVAAFLFLADIALSVCIGIGLVFATIFDKVTKSGPIRH
jgi:hypothetical protein